MDTVHFLLLAQKIRNPKNTGMKMRKLQSFSARKQLTEPKVSALRHPASLTKRLCRSGKKGTLRKWFRPAEGGSETSRLLKREAIFKVVPKTAGTPKIAFEDTVRVFVEGDVTPFSKGILIPLRSNDGCLYA